MPRAPDEPSPPKSFEEHLAALEAVVTDLEGDGLSLEAAIERYRIGVGHLAACRRALDAAEKRLVELAAAADGTVREIPLEVGPEGLLPAAGPAAAGGEPPPRRSAAPRTAKKPSPPAADGDIPF
jgi:exodeoxyribonuclease VII small subunit